MKKVINVFCYLIGLLVMALGIVLIKQANFGISPLSAIPAAVSDITVFSLGSCTTVFHIVCLIVIIIIERRINLKTILIFALAFLFGYTIDFYMHIIHLAPITFFAKALLCIIGILITGLGIAIIRETDLALPAPDALINTSSSHFSIPFAKMKTFGDALWVIITLIIEWIANKKFTLHSIYIGTLFSILLTGKSSALFGNLISKARLLTTRK